MLADFRRKSIKLVVAVLTHRNLRRRGAQGMLLRQLRCSGCRRGRDTHQQTRMARHDGKMAGSEFNTIASVRYAVSFRPTTLFALGIFSLAAVMHPPAWSQTGQTQRSWILQDAKDLPHQTRTRASLTTVGNLVSGTTGCNSFSAKLQTESDGRTLLRDFNATRILCGPEDERVETAIFRALRETTYTDSNGESLRFLDSSRQPLLIWRPAS